MEPINVRCLDCSLEFMTTEKAWFADAPLMCPDCDGESITTTRFDDYVYIDQV